MVAESTTIRNDVHVACPDVGSTVIVLCDRAVECSEFALEVGIARAVCSQSLERCCKVSSFFVQPVSLVGEFLGNLALLTQSLTFLACRLPFLLLLHQIVGS